MKSDWEMGYNAMSGEFVNMMESGVIDPKKVTRSGLMNSCSIAGMVLTTQAVITEIPQVKLAAAAPMADPNDPAAGNFSL
jgi:chaperonin GroEL (HSP60 family)